MFGPLFTVLPACSAQHFFPHRTGISLTPALLIRYGILFAARLASCGVCAGLPPQIERYEARRLLFPELSLLAGRRGTSFACSCPARRGTARAGCSFPLCFFTPDLPSRSGAAALGPQQESPRLLVRRGLAWGWLWPMRLRACPSSEQGVPGAQDPASWTRGVGAPLPAALAGSSRRAAPGLQCRAAPGRCCLLLDRRRPQPLRRDAGSRAMGGTRSPSAGLPPGAAAGPVRAPARRCCASTHSALPAGARQRRQLRQQQMAPRARRTRPEARRASLSTLLLPPARRRRQARSIAAGCALLRRGSLF